MPSHAPRRTGAIKRPLLIATATITTALLGTVTVLASAQHADTSGPVETWRQLAEARQGDPEIPNRFDELLTLAEHVEQVVWSTHEQATQLLPSDLAEAYAADFQGPDIALDAYTRTHENPAALEAARAVNKQILDTLKADGTLAFLDTLYKAQDRLLPITEPHETLINTELNYLSQVRQLAQLQALRISSEFQAGNHATAIDQFKNGIRIVQACQVNPTLIDQLVASSVTSLLTGSIAALDPNTTTLTA